MRKIIQLVMFMYLLLFPAIGLAGEFIFHGIKFGMSKYGGEIGFGLGGEGEGDPVTKISCENCFSVREKIGDTAGVLFKFDSEGKLFNITAYYSYEGDAEFREARLRAITEKSKEFVNGDKNIKTDILKVEGKPVFGLQFVHIPLRNKYINFLKDEMLKKM